MIVKEYQASQLDELELIFQEIRQMPEYSSANSCALSMFTVNVSAWEAEAASICARRILPKCSFFGASTFYGWDGNGRQHEDHVFLFTVSLLETSEVTVLEYDDTDFASVGADLAQALRAMPDVKCVGVFYGGASIPLTEFLENVSEGNEDILFFGAVARSTDMSDERCCHSVPIWSQEDQGFHYVLGKRAHARGMVLAIYCGKELQVHANALLSWRPLGPVMQVSGVSERHIVAGIDGVPAANIFQKYLGIELNEWFMANVCEFPMLFERNGTRLARIPSGFDEENRLYFAGDIQEGEKFQLSYGHPSEILGETWRASEGMRQFAPDCIFLSMCINRIMFLGNHAVDELAYYNRFHRPVGLINGLGEIYCYHGQGGFLHSAMVAVGMREGAPVPMDSGKFFKPAAVKVLPITERMSNFIDAMTQNLIEKNQELQLSAEEAKAANAAKSRFLSNMSHEIRTPIHAILGMDEMILREGGETQILEYAENIRHAGNNLLHIINDVLDLSKIEAGKMDIIPVEYELSSVLNDLVNMITQRADAKGLRFFVKTSPNLPRVLFGDEVRIKQVVTNILTNAVKYTEKGSVTFTVDFAPKDEHTILLRVSVADTGIGIKQEDQAKLFSAFERIEEERNRSIEGTGLGMNITLQLLRMMDSSLTVESVYGEGSTFSFEVEQGVVDENPMGDFAEEYRNARRQTYQEQFTAPEARILVVDDNSMNLAVIRGLLKQTEVRIDTAEGGEECLHMVKEKKYDIIFLDHRMPVMDGVETLREMKKMADCVNANTPVISLTANAISGARELYIKEGFHDYLTKPIDSSRLERMVIEYLPKEKVMLKSRDASGAPAGDSASDGISLAEIPAWLREVKELDVSSGLKNCGSVELYLDSLQIFAEAIVPGAAEIEGYFQAEDWENYTTKVHALKSSAKIIGAGKLSDRAKRLEDAGNSGYVDEILALTPQLMETYRSYLTHLAPLLMKTGAEKDGGGKKPISEEALAEAYSSMREVASCFDYDSMRFILGSLEEYSLPEEEQEHCRKLKEAVEQLAWEQVKTLLQVKA